MSNFEQTINKINSKLSSKVLHSTIENNEINIVIDSDNLFEVLNYFKTGEFNFKQLIDIAGIDNLNSDEEKRFKIVYLLLSHEANQRIKIAINIDLNEEVQSIVQIFPSANWMEREVFDMYGIKFKNHPDLRRILTDYNFQGYPLRKDFPLTGFKEVRYSEQEKKVIYEDVKLEQNYRDFDFDSPWEGTKYIKEIQKKEDGKKN